MPESKAYAQTVQFRAKETGLLNMIMMMMVTSSEKIKTSTTNKKSDTYLKQDNKLQWLSSNGLKYAY
jgi:hypothetical protein